MGALNKAVAAVWGLPALLRPQARLTPPPDPGERIIYMGRSPAGLWVTPDEALKLSAVWACVSVISKAIGCSEWSVLSEDATGNRMPVRNMLWWKLNRAPNGEMTALAFREAMLFQAMIWGNAYAEIARSRRGDPVGIYPLAPERCRLMRDSANDLVLEVMNGTGPVYLPYRNVYHLHGPSISGIDGMSVVFYAARTFGHAAAAEIFGGTFYQNGTQVGGVLSTDGTLTPQQREDLLKAINDRHSGPENAHKFMLLQGGLKFTPLSPTQVQSQFLETRMFLVEEVARWFGVPPHKIAHLERSTNNNIEHQGLEFRRDGVTPWAERMAQEADKKLLSFENRGFTTRFDLEWLSEGDAAARAEADAKLVGAGIRTRNEVRREHGWNTLPDGDGLTVQKQYVELRQIAELTDAEIAKTRREGRPPPGRPPEPATAIDENERPND